MVGKEHSKEKKAWLRAIGTGTVILVVAGTVGIPFDIVAAIALGATLVLLVNP